MNPLPLPLDEVDPKYLVDWLVIQHTCEWCDGDIEAFGPDENTVITPQRVWRCREVKKNGYVSKHWKRWLICRRCAAPHDFARFARWVFPIIKTVMPEHEALSAIMAVQPMGQPNAGIMYLDYVHEPIPRVGRVRGRMQDRMLLDDAGPVNPCGEVVLPEPDQPNRNGRVYAKGAVTYKKWKLA